MEAECSNGGGTFLPDEALAFVTGRSLVCRFLLPAPRAIFCGLFRKSLRFTTLPEKKRLIKNYKL
jgi:hypothetical protein